MSNFMEIFSKIVREHVEDINNNNFVPVYSDYNIPRYELTRLFMIAGINPLDGLRAVPAHYATKLPLITEVRFSQDAISRSIGSAAFNGCLNLKLVVLSSNMIILSGAFRNCTNLRTIIYPGTFEEFFLNTACNPTAFDDTAVITFTDSQHTWAEIKKNL